MEKHWIARFLDMATLIAGWSKDPRTHVGAVAVDPETRAVLATGYNGLPRGVTDMTWRMLPPDKYMWTAHAEENLVANAAGLGAKLDGAHVFVTHMCCSSCARMLIQCGATRVIVGSGQFSAIAEHEPIVKTMFREAGVIFQKAVDMGIPGV